MCAATLLGSAPTALAQVSFSDPTSYPAGSIPNSVAVGDFDADGDPDLAVVGGGATIPGTVSVLLGGPEGTFGARTTLSTSNTTPVSVAVGDFNGDGDPDLAVTDEYAGTVYVRLGAAEGTFGEPELPRRERSHIGGGG